MKIVLVMPDSVNLSKINPTRTLKKASDQLPLGILYMAAATQRAGHDVVVIDNYLEARSEKDLLKEVLSEYPDCVGFSTTVMNIWQAFSVAEKIKAVNKKILTVFGGPQPTIDPHGTMEHQSVDCVVRGEGEKVFIDLLDNLARDWDSIGQTPGVLFRNSKNEIISGPAPEPMKSIHDLPWPARHLVDFTGYERVGCGLQNFPVDVIATSRGCSFKCAFCSSAEYWNRKYRTRPAKDVVDEMEFLLEHYGSKGFYFREDNFTLSRKHVLGICDEIEKRKIKVPWECQSRVDTLKKDVMARMAETGCRAIWCGVESGSQRVLDKICKGVTIEQIETFYKNARELGIRTGASFMVGLPGETEEDVKLSLDLARKINADHAGFLSYVAFPGSPLYQEVCEKKLYASGWESIRFVETENLTLSRTLELERELNKKLRWRRLSRRPFRSISSAVKIRLNKRRHLALQHLGRG